LDAFSFLPEQARAASFLSGQVFLTGPAGSGKTTAGVARLMSLIEAGVPASSILVLVPQRTLGRPYLNQVEAPSFPPGGQPGIFTLGGLGQRLIALFWPMIAQEAGFSNPNQPPSFLTLETAQYYLARLVRPLLAEGYFQTIKIDRNRLLSQVLDNLNKAAGAGFDHQSVADRLKSAWVGEPAQHRAYEEAQQCANLFRRYCLENNLLDFSLQLETFTRTLWPAFLCRQYLFASYRHLIYDNAEEDVPVVHDIISQWLPNFDSALIITDSNGGYRSFLGADPQSADALQELCSEVLSTAQSLVTSPLLENFRHSLHAKLSRTEPASPDPAMRSAITYGSTLYFPELIGWISAQVSSLVKEKGVSPREIAILAPFLSDSLRFSLMAALDQQGIPSRSNRPSRSLREEPATLCLLTFARLAHPAWGMRNTLYDIRTALMQSIENLDLVRADLLSRIIFRSTKTEENLGSFDLIKPDKQERITYSFGERFERLRTWLAEYRAGPPAEMDVFLSRLFGEILSQPGFGFHSRFDAANVAARLIESVQKFRRVIGGLLQKEGIPLGAEYLRMVEEGVIAAQYLQDWEEPDQEAVLLAPAYSFLMANRPVAYQFWLDIGSRGWFERLYQPLTHPYVLSRTWPNGRIWTDADETTANLQTLDSLSAGLIRRCQQGIFLCSNRINERGDEQRSILLVAVQSLLRQMTLAEENNHV
jgi:hypothetical protein